METSGDENSSTAGETSAIDISMEKPAITAEEEFFEDSVQPQETDATEPSDESAEQRFTGVNRGGFRGRWNSGPTSPRFRGRGGFVPNQMGPRRGGPQFFRGGRGGGPPRFPNSGNFDANWNGPQGYGAGNMGYGGQQMELWVETKTEDGSKSYFYHAVTRETTWTRPEGQFVKVMSQSELEAMQKQKPPLSSQHHQQQQQQAQQHITPQSQQQSPQTGKSDNSGENAQQNGENKSDTERKPDTTNVDSNAEQRNQNQTKPTGPAHQGQPMPNQPPNMQGPPTQGMPGMAGMPNPNVPAQMQQFNTPPPFAYGMPPPNFMYPPNTWQMPWQQQAPPIIGADGKPMMPKPGMIDPQILARAAEWSEYRAPDGRPYYYHVSNSESVWEKPQALKDLDAARMAAQGGPQPFPPLMNPAMMPPMAMQQPPVGGLPFDVHNQKAEVRPEEAEEVKLERKRKAEADRKKEEEEKAKLAKPQDKSRPVSSTPIAGTPWCVVWTGDGKVFFYNPSSRTSVWERPDELVGREDVDKAMAATPDQAPTTNSTNPFAKKADSEIEANATAITVATANTTDITATVTQNDNVEMELSETTNADELGDAGNRSDSESTGENDVPNKKIKLTESTARPLNEKKNDMGKEAAIEAEVRAARERALVPLETRVQQFKDMLREKDVSAFSTWEKELHKIVFDPRYLLLTSRERKQVFEKYVKERAEEERREKRNKMRQKREDFRGLMESINLHGKSSFSDFAQKCGKDDRFKGIDKMRDRESLFNEYILEVRRREKDEKVQKKETIRKDFLALLRESGEISRHSRWLQVKKQIDGDKRYRAVDSPITREDYFHDYLKSLKEERRKQKDKDKEYRDRKERKDRDNKHRDKDRRDKGKDSKSNKDDHDKRADSKDSDRIERSKDERTSHNDSDKDDDIISEDGEHPATGSEEEAAERQQHDRDRQMRAIVEREREVQQQLAGHLRVLHKEREHHKRDEAMKAFTALLADLVRNPDLTWKEVKKQLRKDSRWEAVEELEREDRDRIYNDHIAQLGKKKRDKFREMLSELPQFTLTTSWKDIKKQIRDDPRYLKFNSSERCEREFREYIRDKTADAKAAFKELLLECKLISHKSLETVNTNPLHLKEIEDILKNDKRYLTLEHIQYDRTQILMSYLDELQQRGPPPPPTASDSSRRK